MEKCDEKLTGIVSKVTYHHPVTGWSVLRVHPFHAPQQQETVTVHQTKVFAGATMEFFGAWVTNEKYGRQFQAKKAVEKKPATTASIEKYLGSGLIKGVGPKTARKIVHHFKEDTLNIFDASIRRLIEVPGVALKKLEMIQTAWLEHQGIREVMMFLQDQGISTLFAVKIYKKYGRNAIKIVKQNPYQLAQDIYGIGFFSADRVALSLGLALNSPQRILAAIQHVLAASREQGHCYLTLPQLDIGLRELIALDVTSSLSAHLVSMEKAHQIKTRILKKNSEPITCFYSKTLFYEEESVAQKIRALIGEVALDTARITTWIAQYSHQKSLQLSAEQCASIEHIVRQRFSILTGGPGCGKTTTTLALVRLLEAMKKDVLLAAPTGRATQRMAEVIGREAKTIHRLLAWQGGEFKHNVEYPLKADFLIVDECSMLDISLTAALFKAIPATCQVLLIGDADQLPSVGAGNVLCDLIHSNVVPCFTLTKIFRQAQASAIIQYAHAINQSKLPLIPSPFHQPALWQSPQDCLFIDADEVTQEHIQFIAKVKNKITWKAETAERELLEFRASEEIQASDEQEWVIPEKFKHVNLRALQATADDVAALKLLLKKIHPWSSLHYGLTAVDSVVKLYLDWIPKYKGATTEIQILTPMTRGSLGSNNLNKVIQAQANPYHASKNQLKLGDRLFREGDRVIHRRNNYDLNVFNGDIGCITAIDNENMTCIVTFCGDQRKVQYQKEDIISLDLAYAITIHKSQGSEFSAVILPVLTQHFKMLYRNLIYTGLTRAKKLAVFVGTRRALGMAVRQQEASNRQTALALLVSDVLDDLKVTR